MTTKNDDGGTAFPTQRKERTGITAYEEVIYYPGMSLRDYIANHASDKDIESFMKLICSGYQGTEEMCKRRIQAKYAYADAMLEAREK